MRARGPRATVGVVALAALLSGCTGTTVSADAVQESVRDGLADQGIRTRSVSCPEGVQARLDASVVCTVELEDENAFGEPVDRVRVVVKETEGDQVRYRLEPLAVGAPDDAEPAPDPEQSDRTEE